MSEESKSVVGSENDVVKTVNGEENSSSFGVYEVGLVGGRPIYAGFPIIEHEYKGEILKGVIVKAMISDFYIRLMDYPENAVEYSGHIPYFGLPFRRFLTDDHKALSEHGMKRALYCMERIYDKYHDPRTGKFTDFRTPIFAERDRLYQAFMAENGQHIEELKERRRIIVEQYKKDQKDHDAQIKAIDKELVPIQKQQKQYVKEHGTKDDHLKALARPLRERREALSEAYKTRQRPIHEERNAIDSELERIRHNRDEYILNGCRAFIKEQFGVDDSMRHFSDDDEPLRLETFVCWSELV